MNSEFPIGPEKITHGNEYLNFEFRRVPKMNSVFPNVPEKTTSSQANAYGLEEVSNFKRKRSPWTRILIEIYKMQTAPN